MIHRNPAHCISPLGTRPMAMGDDDGPPGPLAGRLQPTFILFRYYDTYIGATVENRQNIYRYTYTAIFNIGVYIYIYQFRPY